MLKENYYSFQTGDRNKFTTVDYVLFGLTLAVSASIGFYYAWVDRRKKNIKEFLMAGGNMSPIPVALSLLASFMSAITLLGTPGEMYNYTTMYWWIGLSYFFVVFGAAHVFLPVFYNLKVTSAYEESFKRLLTVLILMQFIGVGAEDPKLHICIGPGLFYKISVSNTTLKTPFVILKVSVYVETIPSANDRFYSTDQLIVIRIMVVLWIMCFLVSVILVSKFFSENNYYTNITKSKNFSIGTDNIQQNNQTTEE